MNVLRILFLVILALLSLPFLPREWLSSASMKIFGVGVYTPDDVGIMMLLGLIGLIGVTVISAAIWILFIEPVCLRLRK